MFFLFFRIYLLVFFYLFLIHTNTHFLPPLGLLLIVFYRQGALSVPGS